jgi:hypothetical protein
MLGIYVGGRVRKRGREREMGGKGKRREGVRRRRGR